MSSPRRRDFLVGTMLLIALATAVFIMVSVFGPDDTPQLNPVKATDGTEVETRRPSRSQGLALGQPSSADAAAAQQLVEPSVEAATSTTETTKPHQILVIDQHFQPVADAEVAVSVEKKSRAYVQAGGLAFAATESGQTDVLGLYAVKELGLSIRVQAEKAGLGFGAVKTLRSDDELTVVQLQPAVSLRGMVFDALGNALPRARIYFRVGEEHVLPSQEDSPLPLALNADDFGAFSVPVFPGARGEVYAAKNKKRSNRVPFSIDRGTKELNVVLQMPGRYRISGSVRASTGMIVRKAKVTLTGRSLSGYPSGSSYWSEKTALDAAGEFDVALPAAGHYRVQVMTDAGRPSRPIEILINEEHPQQVLALELTEQVAKPIRVLDAAGLPIAGAVVKAWPVDFDAAIDDWRPLGGDFPSVQAETDASGEATLEGLSLHQDYALRAWPETDPWLLVSRVPVPATAEVYEVRVKPEEARHYRISGRSVAPVDGKPHVNAEISLWVKVQPWPRRVASTFTDQDGRFSFESVQAGQDYELQIRASRLRFQRQDLGVLETDLQLDLETTRPVTLEFQLVDRQGRTLPYREIVLKHDRSSFYILPQRVRADSAGLGHLKHLTPGDYRIFAADGTTLIRTLTLNSGPPTKVVLTIPD